MKIKTRCEHCGAVYAMAPEFVGRTAVCKKCHNKFAMIVFENEVRPPAGTSLQPERSLRQGGFQPPGNRQAPSQGDLRQKPGWQAPAAPMGQGAGSQGDFAQQMARQQNRAGGYEPPQGNFARQPDGRQPQGPDGFDQAAFPRNAGPAARPPAGMAAQIFTCKKCGYTAEIPPVSKSMKVKCQNCGAKTTVKPLPKAQAAKGSKPRKESGASGGGPPKILFLLLFIIIIAALVLFVGPAILPGGFPDLLSSILP